MALTAGTRREESHRLRVQAGAISAALPPLLVPAQRPAAATTLGSHGRRRAGLGDSFWQFRPYSTDDTPQSIDWRQSGKVDHIYVREREWVTSQTAILWCDTSPSMRYRSDPNFPAKAERAAVMMLATAELLIEAGERIVRVTGDGRLQRGASSGRLAVAHMADALAIELLDEKPAKVPEVPRFENLPRNAAMVMFSDFLGPLDEIGGMVRAVAHQGIVGHMVQVMDPAEESLPFEGRVRFVGLEHEGATVIDRTEDARAQYLERLAEHRAALKALAASVGWTFAMHHTGNSPQLAVAALHNVITGHRR
ncbi:MAG: DUF58 domain-containing protein [Rhodospirillaceae bacterium]|nr:DUF58 domain-containing protein [Rhodospirillaceae bacterium]